MAGRTEGEGGRGDEDVHTLCQSVGAEKVAKTRPSTQPTALCSLFSSPVHFHPSINHGTSFFIPSHYSMFR